MSEDKLTAEEREAVEYLRAKGNGQVTGPVIAALDRLAPRPAPPEPLPHELPARWRIRLKGTCPLPTDLEECAAELEAALKRWRAGWEDVGCQERLAAKIRDLTACSLPASAKAANWLVLAVLRKELP